jgi:histidinol-phosphate aminotransferase
MIRPALSELRPYEPGRPIELVRRELGIEGPIIKLASNEYWEGPLPQAAAAAAVALREVHRYPDGGCLELRDAVAARHGVTADRVVVGNGADGVLNYLAQALLDPGDEVAYCWPSFPVYLLNAMKMGAVGRAAPLAGSSYDLDALLDVVGPRTKMVFVTNPNNPTGGMVGRNELTKFLDALPTHVLPVIDEAYFEFVDDPQYPSAVAMAREGRPLVALRTFAKVYGLAGLRVGFGIMPVEIATACGKTKGAFDVGHVSQAAAVACLTDDAQAEAARRSALVRTQRVTLEAGLRALSLDPWKSVANFVFVPVGDGLVVAKALEKRGVIVRPTAGFGAPDAIRVTVGPPAEMERFLAELAAVLVDHPVADSHQ